jgi:hypothetical protein
LQLACLEECWLVGLSAPMLTSTSLWDNALAICITASAG